MRRLCTQPGLTDDAERRVGGFSRGMVQRLGLACALVGDPQLLILDEPAAALDPAGRAEMLDLVAAMRGTRTVIFSSHILGDVQRVADRVGILRDGRLLYQGPTQDLIDRYLSPRWLVRVGDDAKVVVAAMSAAGLGYPGRAGRHSALSGWTPPVSKRENGASPPSSRAAARAWSRASRLPRTWSRRSWR